MVLMPRNTTILMARDAMLAADVARFGGANQDLLWQAFAQRGFGQFASVTGNGDTDPVPDFSSPVDDNATLVFHAASLEGDPLPVNANIYVGDYQARVDADRGHRPRDDALTRPRSSFRRRAESRATRSTTSSPAHPATATSASRSRTGGGRIPGHHDPLPDQLRVDGARSNGER